MPIHKLATELEETVRQTRELVRSVDTALAVLLDPDLNDGEARQQAKKRIMVGLQAQDRIQQRCDNITRAMLQMRQCTVQFKGEQCARAWENLTLDELSKPELSGAAARVPHGEVDLF